MRHELEPDLSAAESRDLRRIAGLLIPASAEFDVPGADDAAIFADIVRSLGRDIADVRVALAAIAASASGMLGDLDDARAEALVSAYHADGSRAAIALGRVLLQCYYRDDRVVRSLGLEPRPPFPLGHKLEPGDWSLLDAVRGRAPMWRDVP